MIDDIIEWASLLLYGGLIADAVRRADEREQEMWRRNDARK